MYSIYDLQQSSIAQGHQVKFSCKKNALPVLSGPTEQMYFLFV